MCTLYPLGNSKPQGACSTLRKYCLYLLYISNTIYKYIYKYISIYYILQLDKIKKGALNIFSTFDRLVKGYLFEITLRRTYKTYDNTV